MNLQRLFETQATLDKHILDKHNLHGEDLLDKKILALQVELGELAQNWRGFKFWSENQEPNEYIECDVCTDQPGQYEVIIGDEIVSFPCPKCEGHEEVYVGDRLLEEYVDCLHFILGIGNDFNLDIKNTNPLYELDDITHLFSELISTAGAFNSGSRFIKENYKLWIGHFVSLGKKLGFTWEQIEQAYFAKNKINHERQEQGY